MPSWAELAKPAPRRVPPVTLAPLRPVRSFSFDLTCPTCKSTLELVTAGATDGLQPQAVVTCPKCRRNYLVRAVIEHLNGGGIHPRGPRAKPTKT